MEEYWNWIKRNPNLSLGIVGLCFTLPLTVLVWVDHLRHMGLLPPEALKVHPAYEIFELAVVLSFLVGGLLMVSAICRAIHCRLDPNLYRESDKRHRYD